MIFSYYKYYVEIKHRFWLVLIAWSFALITCSLYKTPLLFMLVSSSKNFDDSSYFIFTDVTEVFYVYVGLSLFLSNQIAILMLFYQSLMFLSLGLYQIEFKKLKVAFCVFMLSWLISAVLVYKLIVPLSWSFFLGFQENSSSIYHSVSFSFEAKISEYLQYFINLHYTCFLSCQFLAALTFFLMDFKKRWGGNKAFRKILYLTLVIFSTIVTPPDVISQVFASSFLIIIYEFLIFFQRLKISMVTN